jgi:hypothetical protein
MRDTLQNLYVSDVLEELLEASSVRSIVRKVTMDKIGRLHPKLDQITAYIGGKCMGYPCLWFLQKALGIADDELDDLLSENYSALFISLSTSIGDDLVDKDENTHIGHLGLLYLLLFKALCKENNNEVNAVIYKKGIEVMQQMLNFEMSNNRTSDSELEKIGIKIGAFHKMISFELLSTLPLEQEKKQALTEFAGKFGCWCSEMDDFIDIERDIDSEQYFTRPVLSLLDANETLKTAVLRKNTQVTGPVIASSAFINRQVNSLVYRLKVIAEDCYQNNFNELGVSLDLIITTLPEKLFRIRARANDIYTQSKQVETTLTPA